jgi:hypothetical protein
MLFERLDYSWSRTLAMLAAHPALGRHIGSIDADLYAEAGFFILRLSHLFPNLDSIGYLTFPGRVQVTDVPRSPLRLKTLDIHLERSPDLAVSLASLVDARTLQSLVVIFFELHFLADLGRFTNLWSLILKTSHGVVLPAGALTPLTLLRELCVTGVDSGSILSQTLPALETLRITDESPGWPFPAPTPDAIRTRFPSLTTVQLSRRIFVTSGRLDSNMVERLGGFARCLREANVRFIDYYGVAWQADWDATP